jgi:hypothetical protein
VNNRVILGALTATLIGILLISWAVWADSDRMLEEAKADYVLCMEEAGRAFDPVDATSQCERDWQEAQDAYWVP